VNSPNLEDQVPVYMSPSDRVVQLDPALWTAPNLEDQAPVYTSPNDRVAPLDSQSRVVISSPSKSHGYSGGILDILHTIIFSLVDSKRF
jgi:hypothetical protein